MKVLLFAMLLQTANPTTPAASGIVTGVVRTGDGTPAAAVRVFAVPAGVGTGAPAGLVGITQTDSAGNYRLEAPAGRYLIAVGAVEAPTYFPGTTNITAAKAVAVTAGSVVSNIDFSGFVPATTNSNRSAFPGYLAGEVRHRDGTVAAGAFVIARSTTAMPATAPIATIVPAAAAGTAVPAGTGAAALTGRVVDQSKALIPGVTVTVTNTAGSQVARAVTDSGGTFSIPPLAAGTYLVLADLPGFQPIRLGVQIVPGSPHHLDLVMRVGTVTTSVNLGFSIAQPVLSTRTDSSGRYRLDVPAGSYIVAAGYMDPPTFFPGVADALSATPVNVPAKTAVDKIDFVIPVPPPRQTVAGNVAAQRGVPLAGAEVTLRSAVPTTGTMPGIPNQVLTTGPEGTFAFRDVLPGTYALEALVSGIGSTVRGITVADSPIANLDFAFSVAVLRGRLLWEDGKPFSDAVAGLRLVAETVDNPNILAGTHLAISPDGMFGGPIKTGTYRIHLQSLPAGYSIVSMTTGSTNLLADALTVKETVVIDVEVRLARRSTPAP